MTKTVKRQLKKFWKQGGRTVFLVGGTLVIAFLSLYTVQLSKMNNSIDPAVYRPLLDLIAQAESNGNYNAYFGNSQNKEIDFTSMSVAEVLKWQESYVRQGSPSSAVGRYQFIDSTLSGLVQRLNIDPAEKFDPTLQDRLAVALLEKRGAREYINEEITREDFAANLAKEWAGLPKVTGENPHESYYASDGLNKSRVPVEEVLGVIDQVDVR